MTISSILNALIAIPKIAGIIMQICESVTNWYVQRATAETNKLIINAAAAAMKAKTNEERSKALTMWRDALSRTRYIN